MEKVELSQKVYDILKNGLSEHFIKIYEYYKQLPVFSEMQYYLDKIIKPDYLDFTINAIHTNILQLRQQGLKHLYLTKSFSDTFLAVSTIPEHDASKAAKYFDTGYIGFLNKLLQESGWGAGNVNIAHWIICVSEKGHLGYHFTYYPMKTDNEEQFYPILAQDLLTETEMKDLGMI